MRRGVVVVEQHKGEGVGGRELLCVTIIIGDGVGCHAGCNLETSDSSVVNAVPSLLAELPRNRGSNEESGVIHECFLAFVA